MIDRGGEGGGKGGGGEKKREQVRTTCKLLLNYDKY